MAEPIISFKDYGFQYLAQASPTLYHINLDIYPGEKVLIAGASGSGKSTIGSCINGLIPYAYQGESTGTLLVGGKDPAKESIFNLSQIVGTVLQDTDGQFIGLTVGEDIAFALENDCVPQSDMKETVREVAKLVDIDHHLEYAPHELSGGQKQRVSLAGVMVEKVQALLFDEPLANLDPAAGRATIELIDRIQERTGAAVIIIEHRLEDVLWRRVDRIVLMDEGRVVADMPTKAFLSGELLLEHGIREPLYLTALRYAGVPITEKIEPQHVDSLRLSAAQKESVQSWYRASGIYTKEEKENSALLSVENLTFGYTPERTNLRDVSFTVREGEMISIVGKNGAGKSTLAKLICGFEKPTAGRICLSGRDISGDTIKERAQRIGYVMQNPNQMISKPLIWDEVEMALLAGNMDAEERRERVEETLKICGLYPFRKWPVSALSFGQKKRVTIAGILVQRPQMIILDEPTAGQDYHHYTEIMEFLKELNAQGFTIVMITHDMHLMLEYTPRAIVFSEGELLADTTAAHVLNDPELVARANLKETSLYTLSMACGIENPQEFTERFIAYEEAQRKPEEDEMARVAILNYIKRPSPVHELTGTTKLVFFLAWSVASMVTFDTRVLVCMLVIGAVIFKVSQIRIRDISVVLGLAAVFLLLNNIFIYLFTPEYGVELYESRTVLLAGIGRYTVTAQQLFYHLNITLKVICVVPVALLFIACTDPSEFAASLSRIGVSYRAGYAVSLALRYIPDVQREYTNISQAQQARGIDLSGKDKLFTRLKNSVAILLPLVMSSLNRIETVSNAMELRGFGKEKKRTWYTYRSLKRNDWLAIGFAAVILIIDLTVTFWDGSRYFNPFL